MNISMQGVSATLFYGTFVLAVALFAALFWMIVRYFFRPSFHKPVLGQFRLIGMLFVVAFCLRFGVECVPNGEDYSLLTLELSFNGFCKLLADSFVHSLQTFSMDEGYTEYLLSGLGYLADTAAPGFVVGLYTHLSNIINVMCPVLGGAVLLDMLCDCFPRWRYNALLTHKRYIFSEINEQSVALAESIAKNWNRELTEKKRPFVVLPDSPSIIFTDSYADGSDERISELLDRVHDLNALTFRCDITEFRLLGCMDRLLQHVRDYSFVYLLVDQNTQENIRAAIRLTDADAPLQALSSRAACAVLTFSDSEADSTMLDKLNQELTAKAPQREAEKKCTPLLMLLAPEQRCAQQLLFHAPLFLPLCSEQYQQLELLVVGSTAFAQEYVRNAYYMGQLLFPGTDRKIPLTIHCVAENEDARKQMEQALRHRMPEVFEPHVEQRAGRIRFYAAEPLSAVFDQLLEQVAGQVSTVLVDPQKEYRVQDVTLDLQRWFLRRELGRRRPVLLFSRCSDAVLGSTLERTAELLRTGQYQAKKEQRWPGSCYVTVFGSWQEQFSYQNIFAPDFLSYSLCLSDVYRDSNQTALERIESQLERLRSGVTDSYGMQANIALAIHSTSKLFSAGLLPEWLRTKIWPLPDVLRLHAESGSMQELDQMQLNHLVWMERLRWCAYSRSQGYQRITPEQWQNIQPAASDPKDLVWQSRALDLRLHNCLVPSDPQRAMFDRPTAQSAADESAMPEWSMERPGPGWDALDRMTWAEHQAAQAFYKARGQELHGANGKPMPGLYKNYKCYDYELMLALDNCVKEYLNQDRAFYTLETLLSPHDAQKKWDRTMQNG